MTGAQLPASLTVLVVDDHPIVRQGLRALLDMAVEELHLIEASTGEEGLRRLAEENVDLVIVDLGLPDIPGLELIRRVRSGREDLPILVLSMQPDDVYAERALRAGASGYLMKEDSGSVLLQAIESVLRGEIYLSERLALQIAGTATGARRSHADPVGDLTDRELEVWKLVGAGMGTRRIAEYLGLSPKTVETHCYNIRQKIEVGDWTELVHAATTWVHQHGLSA